MFNKINCKEKIAELEKDNLDLKNIVREKIFEIRELEKNFDSQMKIVNNEIALKVSEAVLVEKKKLENVIQENAVLKKETEILNKAFENMGFDVKDMKDILNKLVDGIVAKSDIKIISTSNVGK